MKKLAATLLTLLTSATIYALPVGNPWDASLLCEGIFCPGNCCTDFCDPNVPICEAWSFRFGFYGDYVFDRHMEVDLSDNHSTIHDTEIYTNAAYLAFNLWDRFDLFGTLGTTQISILTPKRAFNGGDNRFVTIETETDFSWSIGLRGTILECGCFGFGAEAQYFSSRLDINSAKPENFSTNYLSNALLKYQEWQIGLGVAYRFNIADCQTAIVPYAAIKWSRALMDMDNIVVPTPTTATLFDLESSHCFGYAIGVTLVGCNKMSLAVEGRWVDEKALYVNLQSRF